MNNIRQIITERLENARNEYSYLQKNSDGSDDYKLSEVCGQMEAYADVLNLILPAPRTEADILKDFEKLGWVVLRNNNEELVLHNLDETLIKINKIDKWYKCKITIMCRIFTMQEHKLLNELFEVIFDE